MYSKFSERIGLVNPREVIQKDFIDEPFKNTIWNIYYHYLNPENYIIDNNDKADLGRFHRDMKMYCFEEKVDELTRNVYEDRHWVRQKFDSLTWNQVYEFVEFTINFYPRKKGVKNIIDDFNWSFEKYLSAYRIVGKYIVQLTDENQIISIESALSSLQNKKLNGALKYLNNSLKLLSNRENTDYNNSIFESISALESLCKKIAENDSLDLNGALKIVKTKLSLHDALCKSINELYRYASDTVRHGKIDKHYSSLEDAMFMLVACSNYITYLIVKAQKAEIDFSK